MHRIAYLALAAVFLFWAALFVFAALNPHYSHFTKSVSELGAWGEPNMWLVNISVFIVPGLVLAAFGWMFARYAAPKAWLAAGSIALAGACIAIAGFFPADMSNFTSLTTTGHLVGSNGSVLSWAVGVIALALATRKSWPALSAVSILAFMLMIGAFGLYFTSLFSRAIVQRICFGAFYAWYVAAAFLLLRRTTNPNRR